MEEKKSRIADELRDAAQLAETDDGDGNLADRLCDLADRIDAEMVELPKDKDGLPIHVDDLVWLDDGRRACVTEIDIHDSYVVVDCWDGSKHMACHPSDISHTLPDSLERIADELDQMVDGPGPADDVCEKLADIADRIRRLAAEEGDYGPF